MTLKNICSVALAICLVWLYFDRSILPFIGISVSTISLVYAMYGKKAGPPAPSVSNTITSGNNSINNQTTGTINQNINHDGAKAK